jgi:hypothetical protein
VRLARIRASPAANGTVVAVDQAAGHCESQ